MEGDDFGSLDLRRFAFDAQERRHAWAVDVAVHQADLCALALEADGDIDSHGGFANAAFACADGDDVFDLREKVFSRLHRAAGVGREFDVDGLGADFFYGRFDIAL